MDKTLSKTNEQWDNTQGYELYVGRWSSLISHDFVDWLNPASDQQWLEIGCGTGALTKVITERCSPAYVLAVDKSESYLAKAKETIGSDTVHFVNADLNSYPLNREFDQITSGLVLNFIPQIKELLHHLIRSLKSGGQLSAFVWDYGGHYQPMRHFWDAAKEMNLAAAKFDAGVKFDICKKENLIGLFQSLGLADVKFTSIEKIATFRNFDDYWLPIASAQGSVTEFMSGLTEMEKDKLGENIRRRLPIAFNGEIKLIINALAVRGVKR